MPEIKKAIRKQLGKEPPLGPDPPHPPPPPPEVDFEEAMAMSVNYLVPLIEQGLPDPVTWPRHDPVLRQQIVAWLLSLGEVGANAVEATGTTFPPRPPIVPPGFGSDGPRCLQEPTRTRWRAKNAKSDFQYTPPEGLEGYLPISSGDMLHRVEYAGKGWLKGTKLPGGESGLFPENYVSPWYDPRDYVPVIPSEVGTGTGVPRLQHKDPEGPLNHLEWELMDLIRKRSAGLPGDAVKPGEDLDTHLRNKIPRELLDRRLKARREFWDQYLREPWTEPGQECEYVLIQKHFDFLEKSIKIIRKYRGIDEPILDDPDDVGKKKRGKRGKKGKWEGNLEG